MLNTAPVLRLGITALVCAAIAASAMAGEPLFPKPLHIVRRIDDPVAGKAITVHEYCAGSRIATVNGDRVAIVDYEAQRIVEIDRGAGTYSVTRFEEAAKAQPRAAGAAKMQGALRMTKADMYEARFDSDAKLEIGVDRRFELSRDAVEALIGAAYPSERHPEHDALLEAARGPRDRVASQSKDAQTEHYALPASQITTYSTEGREIVLKNTIVAVSNELAPADVLAIPPGARQVESRITRAARELQALDAIPK